VTATMMLALGCGCGEDGHRRRDILRERRERETGYECREGKGGKLHSHDLCYVANAVFVI
jgi:hypothetical protein